jgi:hypothetical protein
MQPYIAEGERAKAAVVSLKEKLKALKTANAQDSEIETSGKENLEARKSCAKPRLKQTPSMQPFST